MGGWRQADESNPVTGLNRKTEDTTNPTPPLLAATYVVAALPLITTGAILL